MAHPALSYGFRPFFVLAGTHAVLAPALWLLVLSGHPWPGAPDALLAWHAREMVIGLAGAAMAGFLLTAVPSFTGRPATTGGPLVLLAGAWIAGRVAGAFSVIPAPLALVADLAFGLGLLALVARDIVASGNRRNYVIVAVVAAWTALAGASHLGRVEPAAVMHLELVLLTLIAGRIIPAFTGNWMRANAVPFVPRSAVTLDVAALLSVLLAGGVDLAGAEGPLAAGAFAVAALVHGVRLAGWGGRLTLREPLVWSLHLAYAWLPTGYLALAASAVRPDLVPHSAALHALTIGAIGSMIISVMPRVTLGHTGRVLRAGRLAAIACLAVSVAAAARVLAGLWPAAYADLLMISGSAWMVGYALFLVRYAPMLFAPRIDAPPI